jgi:general secretion pathway protein G
MRSTLRIRRSARRGNAGFTLLELMIVLSLMMIIMAIAIPNYQRSIVHARESVLRNDLFAMRSTIDEYTLDKQKAPQSLDDLVSAGYLRQVPVDPFTRSNSTWIVQMEDSTNSVDQQQPGISDVHSGSDGMSDDGEAYNSW